MELQLELQWIARLEGFRGVGVSFVPRCPLPLSLGYSIRGTVATDGGIGAMAFAPTARSHRRHGAARAVGAMRRSGCGATECASGSGRRWHGCRSRSSASGRCKRNCSSVTSPPIPSTLIRSVSGCCAAWRHQATGCREATPCYWESTPAAIMQPWRICATLR